MSFGKSLCILTLFVGTLFAVEVFSLPKVTPELKSKAQEYYNDECKACHRWGRKFAAPPMKENVAQYAEKPEEMVKYLMHPTPKHPETWPPMEITPLTEEQAKMMTAWLLYILSNPEDPGRPK
jgi:cytochrome c551/c552